MTNLSTARRPSRVFATREQLHAAVASIPTTTDQAWRQQQGPRYRLEFSPGSVRVTATDYWLRSKSEGLAADRKARENVAVLMEQAVKPKRGQIREWSEKSRARMPLRFATLDYAQMFEQGELAALVTLTYPMEWQRLAPDAKTFKAHVNRLRQKFLNSWGGRTRAWAGIWKMEFQRRGAPHLHIGTTVPAGVQRAPLSVDDRAHLAECSACSHPAHLGLFEFREWLARTWAAIVFKDHEQPPAPWSAAGWSHERAKHERAGVGVDTDEGQRYSDPKRLAVYFAKHGMFAAKEYQNRMPELWRRSEAGGATFWGYWVVRPLIVSKETHEKLIMHIVRHLRKLADRNSYSRKTRTTFDRVIDAAEEEVVDPVTGEIRLEWRERERMVPRRRKRAVHRRVKRWRNRNGYGYQVVNDGLAFTADIARIIGAYGVVVVDDGADFFDVAAGGADVGLGDGDDLGGAGGVGGGHDDAPVACEAAPV